MLEYSGRLLAQPLQPPFWHPATLGGSPDCLIRRVLHLLAPPPAVIPCLLWCSQGLLSSWVCPGCTPEPTFVSEHLYSSACPGSEAVSQCREVPGCLPGMGG